MRYRVFGRTGLRVSQAALGTATFGTAWGWGCTPEESQVVFERFVDAAAIDATFPPGSVTGAPKVAALEHIAALEPADREIYCGAVGWVDADRRCGSLNVAIRTFWFADDEIRFGTGGGITWDSDPPGEWEETELKARRLLAVAAGGRRERRVAATLAP